MASPAPQQGSPALPFWGRVEAKRRFARGLALNCEEIGFVSGEPWGELGEAKVGSGEGAGSRKSALKQSLMVYFLTMGKMGRGI